MYRQARPTRIRAVTLTVLMLIACVDAVADEPQDTARLPFDRLAAQLMDSVALEPGERWVVVAVPGRWNPLIDRIRAAAREAGAIDLGVINATGRPAPADWRTGFTSSLEGLKGEALVDALGNVDIGIMMPGARAPHPVYVALQDVLRQGRGRTVHYHWTGGYRLDGSPRPDDRVMDRRHVETLTTTDHARLAVRQQALEAAMRGAVTRVTTPAGTDLRFRIGDRPVTRQDGDASARRAGQARNLIDREIELPAGVVRVAPVETSVQGVIAFPPSLWGETRVEGLRLTFDDGRVTAIEADRGRDAVIAELDAAGPAGRAFREFALGLNPELAIRHDEDERWIPYYGYGAGVVRLSLGDNSELGGAVGGGYVRWNFFTDATVRIGDEIWVRDGVLRETAHFPE